VKNKTSADRTNAGGKYFWYLLKPIKPTPHAASSHRCWLII
jgi:hypothetical protein